MALTKIGTDGVKDDAITSGKIPANAVGSSEIADEAVTLAKLPHGTSSNDGKFLRANNGADPTFETITGTTINNNADNRVITGSGTANTLNGESNLTYDGSNILKIQGADQQQITIGSTNGGIAALILDGNSNGDGAGGDYAIIRHTSSGDLDFFARDPSGAKNYIFRTGSSEQVRFQAGGGISFGGDTAAANALDDYEEGTWTPIFKKNGTANPTPSHVGGTYTRIGNIVHLAAYWYLNNSSNSAGSSGYWTMEGLPFSIEAQLSGGYQFLNTGYMSINNTDYVTTSTYNYPIRWQANSSGALNMYGPIAGLAWTNGYMEVAVNGVLRID